MKVRLVFVAFFSWLCVSGQTVIRKANDGPDTLSLTEYLARMKHPDTLSELLITQGTDTMYFFSSVRSRVVAQSAGQTVELTEVFAIPLSSADDYSFVPLRKSNVRPSGLTELQEYTKTESARLLSDRKCVLEEYQALRKEVSSQAPIDEYDEILVKRTAVLLWKLTLLALSGDEEFYAILTNIEEALPSARAGEAGYAWMDCRYLLRAEKTDGF